LLDLWTDKFGRRYGKNIKNFEIIPLSASFLDMIKENKTTIRGAVHGDELQYLYDMDNPTDFPLIRKKFREMSLQFSQNMISFWTNFARDGKPSGDWDPLPEGQGKSGIKWVNLGDKREPIEEPFKEGADFWDSLGLDGLRELPFLRPKNETLHRNGTNDGDGDGSGDDKDKNGDDKDGEGEGGDEDSMWENGNDKFRDIIYVDGDGDEDGTGGLFDFPPL
jgi:hypothetical protein